MHYFINFGNSVFPPVFLEAIMSHPLFCPCDVPGSLLKIQLKPRIQLYILLHYHTSVLGHKTSIWSMEIPLEVLSHLILYNIFVVNKSTKLNSLPAKYYHVEFIANLKIRASNLFAY